jgi:hypothetical protein
VSIDALIDALWGADVPASPRNAIHHHVASARGARAGVDRRVAQGYALENPRTGALVLEDLLARATRAQRPTSSRVPSDG